MAGVGGIVLCGGKSRRMGQPKAWLPFAGEPMLPRIVRLLSQEVAPVVVVAAPGQELPSLPASVALLRDEHQDQGPLEGLRVGLEAMRGECDCAFVSGCDAPFLMPAFVRRLANLLGAHDICVPKTGDFLHPLAAVYRVRACDKIPSLLAARKQRLLDLFNEVTTRIVTADELTDIDPALHSLCNINTLAEYERALEEAP